MHVVATAGHVDHGKSALVRALTGMEPDRWAEERRRGMTIDLGFAWTTLPGGEVVAFVDVPGHERFVPSMLAGVGPVPAVMFVVGADTGWQQQSGEHLAALDAFGVRSGLLVVTRADLADPQPALDEARSQLAATSLAGIEAVAVSAVTGAGLERLRADLTELVATLPAGDAGADVRLWVDRSFVITGAGTVVTGTLTGGTVSVGDSLAISSSGRRVRVRSVQCLGEQVGRAGPVARVALNLRGVNHDEVARGDALLTPEAWLQTEEIDVRLGASARGRSTPPTPTTELTLHVGTAAVPARLRPLGDDVFRMRLARRLPLRVGDRGLLREPSNHHLALGFTVLDPAPPPLRRRGAAVARAADLAPLARLLDATDDPGTDDLWVADEIRRRGVVSSRELRRLGVRGQPAPESLQGDWLVDAALADDLRRRLLQVVADHAREHPLDPAVPVGTAAAKLDLPDAGLLRALLPPGLVVSSGRVREIGPDPGLPPALTARVDTLREALADRPFDAPVAEQLQSLGLGRRELAAAVRTGALLELADGVVLLPDALERAVERLDGLSAPFTVSQAREAWQTSRRVAVPLLERLDATGATERLADGTRRLRAT